MTKQQKTLKILQIGKFYPIRGGVEKVMYDLTLGLSEQQVHCDMLCASTEDYPATDIILNDYARLMIVPTAYKLAATMLAPRLISRLRRVAHHYHIIHIHHPDPMAALALYLSGYKGEVVLHWHSDIIKQKVLLHLYAPLQRWLIRRAARIVGTSPVYVQESPFLKNVQNKIDYIPIGIETMPADQELIKTIKARYGQKKIVFSLGRLVDYKGYTYLIQAAQFLPEDVQIIIGGKGPMKQELTDLIQTLGVAAKVVLIDFIPDQDLAGYYGASDLFCLSSIMKTEAFAIVQIEAMSFGKPVVSTQIPGSGVSWVNKHGESGLTVPIADAVGLATAINAMLKDNRLYKSLSDGASTRFSNLFTRQSMIEKSIQLYTNIMECTFKNNV